MQILALLLFQQFNIQIEDILGINQETEIVLINGIHQNEL